MKNIETGGDGLFQTGKNGVQEILTSNDRKIDIIRFDDKKICYVRSAMGYPAMYPMHKIGFDPSARAVLMDLDGTSVKSEHFWMWIIERTVCELLGDRCFRLEPEDEPFVSGHSVSEHLSYCIGKYMKTASIEQAKNLYFKITHHEMAEILQGRGKPDAFTPAEGLKGFLCDLKRAGVKIALVTSGLYEKAMPEIVSAFSQMDLGRPEDFYDCIITAGYPLRKGSPGTLGELSPKPHPWLYAEAACIGLGMPFEMREKVIGIEDSAAGVMSIQLAGFACIGVDGGNIRQAGMQELCYRFEKGLAGCLDTILK